MKNVLEDYIDKLYSVEPKSLFMLHEIEKGITVDRPIESYGKNVDRVLEDLVGLETTRLDEVNLKLRKNFEIIDAGELKEEGRLILKLKEHIGEDPELVKARGEYVLEMWVTRRPSRL